MATMTKVKLFKSGEAFARWYKKHKHHKQIISAYGDAGSYFLVVVYRDI